MESQNPSKSNSGSGSNKQSLLPSDLFKKTNANDTNTLQKDQAAATSDNFVFNQDMQQNSDKETREYHHKYHHHHNDQNQFNNQSVMAQRQNNQLLQPQLSFEITTCLKMACRQEVRLTTGCKILNDFLRGGFLPRKIYEIYGEAASGKTQFAIQLLLQSILPEKFGGLGGTSLYLITSKSLNEKRFNELKEHFLQENSNSGVIDAHVRDQIIVSQCADLDEYNKIFLNLSQRVETENIKMVVVDTIHSICENFIKSDGSVDYIERSNFLLKHSKLIKKLAYQYNLVVIILNNVVADMQMIGADPAAGGKGFFENKSRGQNIAPSLGLMWSNCVNERICLRKKNGYGGNQEVRRAISLEKSSYMRKNELDFEINLAGIRGRH